MDGVYHVVCRDCQFEGLYEGEPTATAVSDEHRDEHEHRVSKLEIDRPELRKRA